MKIVFWGSDRDCGIESNMIALASYLVCHRGFRVTIFESAKGDSEISEYFPRMHRKYAKVYIETLIEKGLYHVFRPVSKQIMERIEWNMDVIFINMANRTDEEAKLVMKEAEILVVNLRQDVKAFDTFFAQYANLSARILFLVGNYLEDAACNKNYLQSKYRIAKDHLAVIPVNSEFQLACENGQIETYMRRKKRTQMTELKKNFIQSLEHVMQLILEQAKKEMAH